MVVILRKTTKYLAHTLNQFAFNTTNSFSLSSPVLSNVCLFCVFLLLHKIKYFRVFWVLILSLEVNNSFFDQRLRFEKVFKSFFDVISKLNELMEKFFCCQSFREFFLYFCWIWSSKILSNNLFSLIPDRKIPLN